MVDLKWLVLCKYSYMTDFEAVLIFLNTFRSLTDDQILELSIIEGQDLQVKTENDNISLVKSSSNWMNFT